MAFTSIPSLQFASNAPGEFFYRWYWIKKKEIMGYIILIPPDAIGTVSSQPVTNEKKSLHTQRVANQEYFLRPGLC